MNAVYLSLHFIYICQFVFGFACSCLITLLFSLSYKIIHNNFKFHSIFLTLSVCVLSSTLSLGYSESKKKKKKNLVQISHAESRIEGKKVGMSLKATLLPLLFLTPLLSTSFLILSFLLQRKAITFVHTLLQSMQQPLKSGHSQKREHTIYDILLSKPLLLPQLYRRLSAPCFLHIYRPKSIIKAGNKSEKKKKDFLLK